MIYSEINVKLLIKVIGGNFILCNIYVSYVTIMVHNMKLHSYLEQVIGTKAGISILRSLVRGRKKVFTLRGLGKDADISGAEASRTIKQLEKFGIVRVQPVGRAHQISLNDNSYVLNTIVKPILLAEEKTRSEIFLILAKHLTTRKIISAAIFGSVAKGKEKEGSSIDLLVISDDLDRARLVVSDAGAEIELGFHSAISPIIFTRKEFVSKKKGELVRSILSSHIPVTGSKLVTLK